MLSIRRWTISLVVLMVLIAGGMGAWLYFGQLPKKVPLRARPVFTGQLSVQTAGGRNQTSIWREGEHNKLEFEHTIAEPKFQQGGI